MQCKSRFFGLVHNACVRSFEVHPSNWGVGDGVITARLGLWPPLDSTNFSNLCIKLLGHWATEGGGGGGGGLFYVAFPG